LARRLGWTEAQIASLHHPDGEFNAAERTALRFTELMTLDPHGVTEDFLEELRTNYSEGEIVEIAAVVGLYNYFNRFAEALSLETSK
jgi:alkylhydroperoxidase family enzyme